MDRSPEHLHLPAKLTASSATLSYFDAMIADCCGSEPLPTAVVHPCDEVSLRCAVIAAQRGLISPTLVGPAARIQALAASLQLDISALPLIDVPHSHAAAARAVELARAGSAEAILKGSLHTDELMEQIVHSDTGLRTERRISHVFVMDVPAYPKPLLITDAAVNLFPTLDDKADILRNAIDLAHGLGIAMPKAAILSAVETVSSRIPSTIDAAALCKMSERGQIEGALVDGPLAFDNAISKLAAEAKHIRSAVAGDADILLVPNLEAGNMLAKELSFLAGGEAAGLVMGARVPVVLNSRADSLRSHLAGCAVAVRYALYRRAQARTAIAAASAAAS